jgi:hypothetical protein
VNQKNKLRFSASKTVLILLLTLIQTVNVQATPETIVQVEPYSSSVDLAETFAINVTIVEVQNLYGISLTLSWNSTILQVIGLDLRLGVESHPDGVLHELPYAPIFIVENNLVQEQGKYFLGATSVFPASSYNGTGNIVTVIFNVTSFGDSKLDLETQLYDYPPPDREPRISWPIEHLTIGGFFNIIPEFSILAMLLLLMVLAGFVILVSRRFREHLPSHDSPF